MVTRNTAADRPRGPDVYEQIADRLGDLGWCVTPDFLPPCLVDQLRAEAERLWQERAFRLAGVGRGEDLRIDTEIRTDHVRWLDPASCSDSLKRYLHVAEQLRRAINRRLFLGLFDFDGHLAVYPPGTYYRKHLDQFRGIGLRTVTCILYLNQDWTHGDGGQLRIYTDPTAEARFEEILPLGGQFVTFLSARFLHEVMPARRSRMSITGWLNKRG